VLAGQRAEIAPSPVPGADPSNLCGNAREGKAELPPTVIHEEPVAPAAPAGVSVVGLGHAFGELETLRELSFEVAGGETVAVVGPSGCGKSTLLELIGGLADGTYGTVSAGGGATARERLAACAWMPQRDGLLPWRRAVDNAGLGLRLGGMTQGEARYQAGLMLARLGLAEFGEAYPGKLSGGMRQRVAFARTLLTGKPVLLLDEPFAALDAITRADLQEWLRATLRAERRTTVLVTHDVEEALYLGDRVLVLSPRPGRIVWTAVAPPPQPAADRAAEVSHPDFVAVRHEAQDRLRTAGAP
jgi:NitT/TauT family transport system ATP-binding protein